MEKEEGWVRKLEEEEDQEDKEQLLHESGQGLTRELGNGTFISGTLTPLSLTNTAIVFP